MFAVSFSAFVVLENSIKWKFDCVRQKSWGVLFHFLLTILLHKSQKCKQNKFFICLYMANENNEKLHSKNRIPNRTILIWIASSINVRFFLCRSIVKNKFSAVLDSRFVLNFGTPIIKSHYVISFHFWNEYIWITMVKWWKILID